MGGDAHQSFTLCFCITIFVVYHSNALEKMNEDNGGVAAPQYKKVRVYNQSVLYE